MDTSMPWVVRRTRAWILAIAVAVALGLAFVALAPVFASASTTEPGAPGLVAPAERTAVVGVSLVPSGLTWTRSTAPVRYGRAEPEIEEAFVTARVESGSAALRVAPGGSVVTTLGTASEFGSPRTLSVVKRDGRWLGVIAPELGNGTIAWIDSRKANLRVLQTRLSVEIDLSRRLLVVKRDGDVLRKIRIGVGAPASPTPIGRFAVTDKLPGARYSSSYGCCILALSAKQPNLPAGWRGGDRIAVHGTNNPATIGAATSAGCPHASERDLRYLMRKLPLGTPVFVHP